jgi:peptidyl-prolyl cis-trans isomerase B (cyclophilin B)
VNRIFFAIVFLAAAAVAAQAQSPAETPSPKREPAKANARPAQTEQPEPFEKADAAAMAGRCVTLETEAGSIELEFFPEVAPASVRNFLNLVATGLLDNTTFSRVVPNFVIQGGDLSTGDKWNARTALRSQRSIPDEPSRILHERGIVSMARSDEPNSATTHFFILVTEAPFLDGKFAAFGRVTKGMETVDSINKAAVNDERPEKPVRIKKAVVGQCIKP